MSQRLVFDERERVAKWVADKVDQKSDWGSFYAMGAERDGELVAGIVMNNFNGANAVAHIAIAKPGKDTYALFRAFSDYAFRQCGLRRLTGLVPSDMPKVLAFDLRLGFEEEFIMRSAAPDGHDMHVLVMWADTCPWQEGTKDAV